MKLSRTNHVNGFVSGTSLHIADTLAMSYWPNTPLAVGARASTVGSWGVRICVRLSRKPQAGSLGKL